jgi:single-strand DNA-binding protein
MFNSAITIGGNVIDEPTLRFTKSSVAVASFTVAVDRGRKVNGKWETETAFVDVTAWESLGEYAAESFVKGQRVVVMGTLKQDNWETSDGSKRSKLCMVADDCGVSVKWGPVGGNGKKRSSQRPNAAIPDEEPF